MPQVRGWSEDEVERYSLNLAAQLRRAWRAVIKKLIGKKASTITLSDLGSLPDLWASQIDPNLLGYIGMALYDGAARVLEDTGQDISFVDIEDAVETYLKTASNRLANIGDDIWGDVRSQLLIGYGLNEDYTQLAARVKHTANVSDARALRIARTEMHAALEAGSYEQALLVDPNGKKTWLATEDERTRPSHTAADGQVVKIGERFSVGATTLRFPGDPSGAVEEIVNCRCALIYDLEPSDIITHVSDEVIVAAGRDFKEEEHPRGNDGKFITNGTHAYTALTAVSDVAFQYSTSKLTQDDWGKLTSPQKGQILKRMQDLHTKYQGGGFTEKILDHVTQLAKTGGVTTPQAKITTTNVVPSNTPAVPADIYKQWPDGHVVAISKDGNFRFTWSAGQKKYLHQTKKNDGTWETLGSPATKKLAYNAIMVAKDIWVKPRKGTPSLVEPEIKELSRPKDEPKSPFHVVPKEERGKSGDGYAAPGLWGKYGAAGVMIRNVGPDGVERFLMVQRGPGVSSNVGKWQLPGGALEEHETPEQGAAREIFEEVGASDAFLAGMKHSGTHAIEVPVPGQKPWVYSNIAADSPTMFDPKVDGTETGAADWMTAEDIQHLADNGKLHPALAKNLPQVLGLFSAKQEPTPTPDNLSMDASYPTDLSSFKKISGAKGSNAGGIYEAPDGTRYYVKHAKTEKHAQNDVLASNLYQLAGVDVPQVYVGKNADGLGERQTFTKIVPDAQSDLASKIKDPEYKAKVQDGFAVDAWLANWDVAGTGLDNIVTDGNGNPVRIDTGGSLLFRAQGGIKGAQFTDDVGELDSLRNYSTNPQSAKLFGDMDPEQIRMSAAHVESVTPEQIDAAVMQAGLSPNIATKLKKRREDILKRYPPAGTTPITTKDLLTSPKSPIAPDEDRGVPEVLSDLGLSSQKDWMALSKSEKDEVISELNDESIPGNAYESTIKSWEPNFFDDNADPLDGLVPASNIDEYVMSWDHDVQDAALFSAPGAVLAATADGQFRVKYNTELNSLDVQRHISTTDKWEHVEYVSLYDEDIAHNMNEIPAAYSNSPFVKWVNVAGIDYLGLNDYVADKNTRNTLLVQGPVSTSLGKKIMPWGWSSVDHPSGAITSKYFDEQIVAQTADGKMKITWHDDDDGYRVSEYLNSSKSWKTIDHIAVGHLSDAHLSDYGEWFKSTSEDAPVDDALGTSVANWDGTPNWDRIKSDVWNGSIPAGSVLATTNDGKIRITKHLQFPSYVSVEQYDDKGGWYQVEVANVNTLEHTANGYGQNHNGWSTGNAPQPIQELSLPEPTPDLNAPYTSPASLKGTGADISNVSSSTQQQIQKFFKAKDAKWHSKSQHIWDTIQAYRSGEELDIPIKYKGKTLNGHLTPSTEGKNLSDLQILAILDAGLQKNDNPYVTKMTKWLGTPAGKKHAKQTKVNVPAAVTPSTQTSGLTNWEIHDSIHPDTEYGTILAVGSNNGESYEMRSSGFGLIRVYRKNKDGSWTHWSSMGTSANDIASGMNQPEFAGMAWVAPNATGPTPSVMPTIPSKVVTTQGLPKSDDDVDLDAIYAKGLKFHPIQVKHQLGLAEQGSVLAYGKANGIGGANVRMVYGESPYGTKEIQFQIQAKSDGKWITHAHAPASQLDTITQLMGGNYQIASWKNAVAVPLKTPQTPATTSTPSVLDTNFALGYPKSDNKYVDIDQVVTTGTPFVSSDIDNMVKSAVDASVLGYGVDSNGAKWRIVHHKETASAWLAFQKQSPTGTWFTHESTIVSNGTHIEQGMNLSGGSIAWKSANNAPLIPQPTPGSVTGVPANPSKPLPPKPLAVIPPAAAPGKALATPEYAAHPQLKLANGDTVPKTVIVSAWGPFTKKTQYSKYSDTVLAYSTDGNERIVFSKSGYFSRQKWDADQKAWKKSDADTYKLASLAKGQKWYPMVVPQPAGGSKFKASAKNLISQSNAMAASSPSGTLDMGDGSIDHLTDAQRSDIYKEFRKHVQTSSAPADTIYKAAKLVADQKNVTLRQALRAIDDARAKKNNLPNEGKYEKLVQNYLATPQGYAKALNLPTPTPPRPKFTAGVDPDTQVPSFEESSKYDYKIIDNITQAKTWWDEVVAAHGTPWTSAQQSGLRAYTGGISYGMNSYLYGESSSISSSVSTSMHQSQLGMRPSIKPVLLHRGVNFKSFKVANHEELESLVGQTRDQMGFNSSSIGGSAAMSGQLIIEIEAPPGTPMAWVEHISQHPGEREMLVAAGVYYKILKVWKSGTYGQSHVRVRVVPPPEGVTS